VQFLLYCLCGGLGVTTDYAVFWLAVTGGAWYQAANALGYLAGTLVSFALNRVLTFKQRDRVGQRLAMFLAVAGLGFASSAALLWLLVDLAHLDARIAKLLTLPVVVVLQFSLNRRFSFRAAGGGAHG
jgi:putative flippase GtrA